MLQLLKESNDGLIAFRISGEVDINDYKVMLPLLEEKIKQHGKLRVYAEVQDVEAYTLQALYNEVKFDFKHANDFTRAAIIGNQKWIDWLTIVATPFTTAKVKYFDFDNRAQAWDWLNTGSEV